MEIYLLRHGSAERGRPGSPDSDRALTGEGRYEIQRVMGAAKLARTSPSLILSSPYKRAFEAARLAAGVLDYKGEIVVTDALTPESGARGVWDEIRVHRGEEGILLVGHEPLFSACTAYLAGCPDLQVEFAKAGLVRIDVDGFNAAPRGILKWMLTPDLTV
jgi:phosphohistidine phosphatase